MRFFIWGTLPIGGLLGGIPGEALGVRTTVWIGAFAGCLAFIPVFFVTITVHTCSSDHGQLSLTGSGWRGAG